MGSPKDPPESPDTLPRPELNPLLNPRLADNMGRWAEVYFTSPPEKREEAVQELLQELEAENPEQVRAGDPALQTAFPEAARRLEPAPRKSSEEAPVNFKKCPSCGHDNPVSHQFCGMCGAPTGSSAVASTPDASMEERESRARESNVEDTPDAGSGMHTSTAHQDDLSLFRSFSAHRSADDYDLEPHRPYRVYIGVGLAILILILGYMAWSVGRSQGSHQASAPPSAATTEKTQAPESQPTPANSSKEEQQKSGNSTAKSESPTPTETPVKPTPPKSESAQTASNQTPSNNAAPMPPSPENAPPTSATAGGEELATAQRYLAGSNGQARDSAEAARWLWKAMAKHNGEAALLLADLYLKGDGVSQNCDQARILLDTAARRGIAGAGERLRNLQAFGCQ